MKFPKTYSKDKHSVNVIIETPYKSRNKYSYDIETGLFKLSKVLPAGMAFPCDMGFVPHTIGEDGDPLDALILMDEITYPGCLVECRLLGVIKAAQAEEGKKEVRNDRFVFVPLEMKDCDHLNELQDVSEHKVNSISCFFENYNKRELKEFRLLGLGDSKEAHTLLKKQKTG
jgi:inorganic pyrophosphatase